MDSLGQQDLWLLSVQYFEIMVKSIPIRQLLMERDWNIDYWQISAKVETDCCHAIYAKFILDLDLMLKHILFRLMYILIRTPFWNLTHAQKSRSDCQWLLIRMPIRMPLRWYWYMQMPQADKYNTKKLTRFTGLEFIGWITLILELLRSPTESLRLELMVHSQLPLNCFDYILTFDTHIKHNVLQ